MSAPCQSACSPWTTTFDDGCAPCAGNEFDAEVVAWAVAMATDVLFERSRRRWPGVCREVDRPCAAYAEDAGWPGIRSLVGYRGSCSCNRGETCGCSRLSEWRPRGQPLVSVEEVILADRSNPAYDGTPESAVLDPALYRIDDFSKLVRLRNPDGSRQGWPCCQEIDLAAGEPGTWQVTYVYGKMPPITGVMAAKELACHLALACTGGEGCELGPNVVSVARQGITVSLEKLAALRSDTLIGLPISDMFLSTYNPTGRRGVMRVFSPDLHASGRKVDT